jgi:acetylornithine deacetylase/succinyl-diaminopimelate desuccinylase-like protein
LRLTERDGQLFARGACDAKGAIAAMVEAGRLPGATRGARRCATVLFVGSPIRSTSPPR